jgi:hypothetical protein
MLEAWRLESLEAPVDLWLSGFPASQLSGFSASQLFMAEMQTAKRVSPDLSMIRTIVKLWGRERKRSRTLILVFRIIIHIFSV